MPSRLPQMEQLCTFLKKPYAGLPPLGLFQRPFQAPTASLQRTACFLSRVSASHTRLAAPAAPRNRALCHVSTQVCIRNSRPGRARKLLGVSRAGQAENTARLEHVTPARKFANAAPVPGIAISCPQVRTLAPARTPAISS